jgi:zinc transport system substrate-binding protein
MLKRLTLVIVSIIMVISLSSCGKNRAENTTENTHNASNTAQKIKIMVSFNPLKEFAEAVGGDKIEVKIMVPPKVEAHDFEPTAKDIAELSNSKIFVYNGLGMESWVDKVLQAANNKNLTIVEASKGCELIKNKHQEEIEEHGEYDPHVWLSLKEAKVQSKNIKEALVKVDPSNKDFYEKNYQDFVSKLDSLYSEYKQKFQTVKSKSFVTGHAAFAYLCRDFGLEQNSVEETFSEGEPTPKKLQELVEYCKKNNVKTVFMEEMASPKVSETLAKEIGGKVEKIYTIESKEDNKDYMQSMRDNLERIYSSLK